MDITTLLIAVALAMDSFSVAIAHGLATKKIVTANAIKIATFFGFFQAAMPLIGWYAGIYVLHLISDFDHWIAFILLTFIGSRMIYECFKDETEKLVTSLSLKVLLLLSIATSIDALAVGLSVATLNVSIVTLVIVTGVVTFMLSFFGVHIGGRFGCILKNRVEALGGIILIVIGLKILLEHIGIL
jgi:putative Mn2+ efflux pump MntP